MLYSSRVQTRRTLEQEVQEVGGGRVAGTSTHAGCW